MKKTTSLGIALFLGWITPLGRFTDAHGADAQPPPVQQKPAPQARPQPPTRAPNAPGTPKLTPVGAKPGEGEILHGAPGMNPPVDADGDFLIGPDYMPAPELNVAQGD